MSNATHLGSSCTATTQRLSQFTSLTSYRHQVAMHHAVAGVRTQHVLQQRNMAPAVAAGQRRCAAVVVRAEGGGGEKPFQKNTQFGYSRKDVILIGAGLTAIGVGLYYGLQAAGMDAGMAGNYVQLAIIVGMSVGWVGSYLLRVANKDMTYVKQLEEYEEAVMRKRLEEMPEAEVERVMGEIEREKREIERRRGGKKL